MNYKQEIKKLNWKIKQLEEKIQSQEFTYGNLSPEPFSAIPHCLSLITSIGTGISPSWWPSEKEREYLMEKERRYLMEKEKNEYYKNIFWSEKEIIDDKEKNE